MCLLNFLATQGQKGRHGQLYSIGSRRADRKLDLERREKFLSPPKEDCTQYFSYDKFNSTRPKLFLIKSSLNAELSLRSKAPFQ